MDQNGCPANYDELAANYFVMARSIVARAAGVSPDDVDDLTQDILLKFIEKDFLSQYDPTRTFMTPSGPRHARFPTLFRSFVKKFLRTPIETLASKAARVPVRLQQPTQGGDLWMEVHAPVESEIDFERADLEVELDRAYRHLATVPLGDGVMADELLRALIDDAAYEGKVVRSRIAERLGVQDTTITRWTRLLRAELSQIGFGYGEYVGESVPA